MIHYKTLEDIGLECIHTTFLDAFSDYEVKMDIPYNKFEQMLHRRGFSPRMSIGAFCNNQLIGFVLNGFRNWEGIPTIYDLGTGIIPTYRRQGITKEMLIRVHTFLKEQQARQYLLEVIQSNKPAYTLYQQQGFEVSREFGCYQLEKKSFHQQCAMDITKEAQFNIEGYRHFWDSLPSWQNSVASIKALESQFSCYIARKDDQVVGYGIINPQSGDITQIAVDKSHRKKGVGRSILTTMIREAHSDKISILNVEKGVGAMEAFLEEMGFKHYIDQFEMVQQL